MTDDVGMIRRASSAAMIFGIFCVALYCMSGCSVTRFYPLCVFGPDSRIPSDQALHEHVDSFIRSVVGTDGRIAVAPNERFVSVDTFVWTHRTLRKVWPRAACIGQTRYDEEYDNYKACVTLIEVGLRRGGIPPLGQWSDGIGDNTIYCGRNLEDQNKRRGMPVLPP
jgi:hypothetical protein